MALFGIPTLDDLNLSGRRVLLRSDMNVPLDREGHILDHRKIDEAAITVKELVESGAKTIVGTHQGRPGGSDFTSTEMHCHLLSERLDIDIQRVDGVLCRCARERISATKDGEVLMLENLRFCAEENIEMPPTALQQTNFFRRLAPQFDAYVNDAFHAAHRSQPSLTGFPYVLPSGAGRSMERMIGDVEGLDLLEGKRLFVVGGAKIVDKFRIIDHALRTGKAAEVLVGGLTAVLISMAAGHSVGRSSEDIERAKILLPAARDILRKFEGRIFYPVDYVVLNNGDIEKVPVYLVPKDSKIVDIGPGTIELYRERVSRADLTVANGPLGVFEDPRFREGTLQFVKGARKASKNLVLCGGHLSAASIMVSGDQNNGKVYTAGGAVMFRLAGLPMPAIKALREGGRGG